MTRWRRFKDTGSRFAGLLSLCVLSLVYGVVAARYDLFPSAQVRDAMTAAEALYAVVREELADVGDDSVDLTQTKPVVWNHVDVDDDALILVSGGPGFLESYHPNGGCLAWLMNRKGEIQHVWEFRQELWSHLEHVSEVPGMSETYPVGVHLLDDGGLIVSFQGTHTWPFAVGIARLDKDSNTVWKKECNAHHWFTVTADRKIITPTLRIIDSPQSIGHTPGQIIGQNGKVLEDMLTVMSLDGEVLEEISMLDVVHNSGLIGLYQGATGTNVNADTDDPLHLNAVREVGQTVASAHDWLNADDLLVSFRSLNLIAILDRSTWRVKWYAAGTTLRQHSPCFADSDHILVFDNLGGDPSRGGTRLARIELESRLAETIFPPRDHQPIGRVYSQVAGHLDLNRQRDAVLMTLSNQSRVLEIDLDNGKVLWEYRFVDPVTKRPVELLTAKYCYDVTFEMNQTHLD